MSESEQDTGFDSAVESVLHPTRDPEQPPASTSPPRSGRGGARPGAGRPKKHRSGPELGSLSAPVQDPPQGESSGSDRAPVDPKIIAQLVRRADAVIVAFCKTRPLERGECDEGGEVLAPLVDHYLPDAITSPGGIAMAWVLTVYGPRALEVWEQRQAAETSQVPGDAAQMPTAAGGAPPGAGFSERDAGEALQLGYVAPRPSAHAA